MIASPGSILNRIIFILVLSLLAVSLFAPSNGFADGNGGLPVGGQGSGDTLPPDPAPELPGEPEQETSLITTLLIITLLMI